ncbi:hypothetical protein JAAARDRAFT_631952 [Jaapia argillacea MUCL 33604]|uniref:Uncharacterized protein n=1 Tax=Jaapia argillacea MUCL 33604 TaxID=933084 RepID=A0A067Q8D7_9AGAM|nr:hypothetical protein JAAARDRAFT_631952 [Jaapia argillacea MUCL 33604]
MPKRWKKRDTARQRDRPPSTGTHHDANTRPAFSSRYDSQEPAFQSWSSSPSEGTISRDIVPIDRRNQCSCCGEEFDLRDGGVFVQQMGGRYEKTMSEKYYNKLRQLGQHLADPFIPPFVRSGYSQTSSAYIEEVDEDDNQSKVNLSPSVLMERGRHLVVSVRSLSFNDLRLVVSSNPIRSAWRIAFDCMSSQVKDESFQLVSLVILAGWLWFHDMLY